MRLLNDIIKFMKQKKITVLYFLRLFLLLEVMVVQ